MFDRFRGRPPSNETARERLEQAGLLTEKISPAMGEVAVEAFVSSRGLPSYLARAGLEEAPSLPLDSANIQVALRRQLEDRLRELGANDRQDQVDYPAEL